MAHCYGGVGEQQKIDLLFVFIVVFIILFMIIIRSK